MVLDQKRVAMKKESHTKKLAIKTTFSIGLYLFFFCANITKLVKKVAHHTKKIFYKKSEMLATADSLAHAQAYFWI